MAIDAAGGNKDGRAVSYQGTIKMFSGVPTISTGNYYSRVSAVDPVEHILYTQVL